MASLLLLATLGTACAEATPEEVEQLHLGSTATPVLNVPPAPLDNGLERGVELAGWVELPLSQLDQWALQPVPAVAINPGEGVSPPAPEDEVSPPGSHVAAAGSVSAPPPPAAAPETLTADDLLAVFAAAGWPAEENQRNLNRTWCESRWHPGSINSAGPFYGLFQVLEDNLIGFHIPRELWLDPVTNATVARWLWESGGPGQWPNC